MSKKDRHMENERRKHTRVPVGFNIVVTVQGEEIPISTKNISLRGMQCPADERFKVGETCHVAIILTEGVTISIDGKILRTKNDGVGIFFSTMSDSSYGHLKRLVRYNSDDPDKIDEELIFID